MPKKSPAPDVAKLVYSREEAAAALGVCLTTIDGWIVAKTLKATKPGRRVLIKLRDIEAMLDASTV